MCRTFQKSINRMSRATLGVLPSTLVAFLQAEGGSVPAEARLNGRQEAFAIRLASRDGLQGQLLRVRTGLGSRLKNMVGIGRGEEVEQVGCSRGLVFPGVVFLPGEDRGNEEKEEVARQAMIEANAMKENVDTVWTDGSRLENGRVGVGMAWYEKGDEEGTGSIMIRRRDSRRAGQRREGKQKTYPGEHRSMRRTKDGWRSSGFRLGGGHEAYDAEVAAIAYGLAHLHGRMERGHTYTIFTDSVAAMRRVIDDAPRPGQHMAVRAIDFAERIVQRGGSVTIRWIPAHRGVEGNERADQAAKEAAVLPPPRATRGIFNLAFLNRGVSERMVRCWVSDTRARAGVGRDPDRGAYALPSRGARPGIRPALRRAKKSVAARFFQLLSGHAMIAPFLRDRWGWTDTDRCWWCEKGRQSREHLFKKCRTWEKEIRMLWKAVGEASGRRGRQDGVDRPSRVGRVSVFMLGRQGRGPATLRFGSSCQMTGTLRQFWSF